MNFPEFIVTKVEETKVHDVQSNWGFLLDKSSFRSFKTHLETSYISRGDDSIQRRRNFYDKRIIGRRISDNILTKRPPSFFARATKRGLGWNWSGEAGGRGSVHNVRQQCFPWNPDHTLAFPRYHVLYHSKQVTRYWEAKVSFANRPRSVWAWQLFGGNWNTRSFQIEQTYRKSERPTWIQQRKHWASNAVVLHDETHLPEVN